MTTLITIRDNIKAFLSKYEKFVVPVFKFLCTFIVLLSYKFLMGYSSQAGSGAVMFVVALLSAFLPVSLIVLLLGLVGAVHMYAVGIDVALLYVAVFLLMYILYVRFAPKYGWIIAVMPFLYMIKLHYCIPIVVGIFIGPVAIVPVVFGVIFYYFIVYVAEYKDLLETVAEGEAIQGFNFVLDGLLKDKQLLLTIIVFSIIVLVTYIIYRLPFKYASVVSIVTGAVLNVILLSAVGLVMEADINIGIIFLGTLGGALIAVIAQFFKGLLDYSRTETVQFEDEDFYYYVKAVPKIRIAEADVQVKKIREGEKEQPKPVKTDPAKENSGKQVLHIRPVQLAQKAEDERRIEETKRAMERQKAKLAAREQAEREKKAARVRQNPVVNEMNRTANPMGQTGTRPAPQRNTTK